MAVQQRLALRVPEARPLLVALEIWQPRWSETQKFRVLAERPPSEQRFDPTFQPVRDDHVALDAEGANA